MVVVYFETPNHSYAEIVAVFDSEDLYNACYQALEKKAKEAGMVVTESCGLTEEEVAESLTK